MECSCRLWPTPGIYVVTSIPLVSRTRATLRSAEFGFFGVEVYTRVQTPRFCGQLFNAGLDVFHRGGFRPLRTSWLNVGTNLPFLPGKSKVDNPLARREPASGFQQTDPNYNCEDYLLKTGPCSIRCKTG